MSLGEFFHYAFFSGLFLAFTYNKKQPPGFGPAPAFWSILLSFLGLLFCHIANNLSKINVLTANAPFFYQISGTWSNHEGSILLWCRILSFYGFLFSYRQRPKSQDRSKEGGPRQSRFSTFLSNFVKKSTLALAPTTQKKEKKRAECPLDTPCLLESRLHAELPSTRKKALDLSFERHFLEAREKKTPPFFQLTREEKERVDFLEEEAIDGALGIALFFSLFLAASSDPFVRNFFISTEPLAESNPVLQDPILAIHPPCIYAGDVASAIGFALARAKMRKDILAIHSPLMRKEPGNQNARLLTALQGSNRTRELCILQDGKDPTSQRSFQRLFFQTSKAERRETLSQHFQTKLPHPWKKKETNIPTLAWTAGQNTVVYDHEEEVIRIWILIAWAFLTIGILLGSWWAYHELGWGGWWFRDPVENASFMPWVLATAAIHTVSLPMLHSWTYLLNILIFPAAVLGTLAIRAGVLASVHSFANDDTRGILLARFLLLITAIATILFTQIKQQKKEERKEKDRISAKKTKIILRKERRLTIQ